MKQHLRCLLEPASIAMIGASNDPGRIGGLPLALLTRYGYQGAIYPINPKYDEVFGLRCYPDIESTPAVPELVVLAIGAGDVLPMLQRCHARGVSAAIVYAAGFAEQGGEGLALQQALESFAHRTGMAVAGPNCMGLANLNLQAHTAFASVFNSVPMQQRPGNIALLTQSGNVCAALYALLRERELAVSHFINTGNEACVEFSEYLAYLAQDPQTDVVLGYVEQLRHGGRFLQACRALAAQDKMLVALKAGTTEKGAVAVQSHTSAMAGDQRVYQAVFRDLNVVEAHDFAQMADLAMLAQHRSRHAGPRVAILTMSGALGAILADRFTQEGLALPDLPADVQRVLRQAIPDYGMVGNPVDVTGHIVNRPELIDSVLSALASSAALDTIVVYAPGYMLDRMAPSMIATAQESGRLLVAIDTGKAQCRQALREAGIVVFDDIGRAVRALGPYLQWQARRQARKAQRDTVPVPADNASAAAPEMAMAAADALALPLSRGMDEVAALRYLAGWGVPVKPLQIASDAAQAVALAHAVGYPVAMKIVSADIAHKTEAGGVALGLQDDAALMQAHARMMASVRQHAPDAVIQGVVVQPMEAPGVDLLVGVRRDPLFGPMLTVGLGGILTELYQDTSHALLPVTPEQVESLLRTLRAFPLLDGFRNAQVADVQAACKAIATIGDALCAAPAHFKEIEVNPLRVREHGQGVVALDALMVGG